MDQPHGKTVMMVEDDVFLSDLLSSKLAKVFNVMHASSGEQALELPKKQRPDLILLDVILPGIDGFEVLKQMKANPDTASIPVIILSNLGQESDIKKGKDLGAEEYVVKVTLMPDQIVDLVQAFLAREQKQPA